MIPLAFTYVHISYASRFVIRLCDSDQSFDSPGNGFDPSKMYPAIADGLLNESWVDRACASESCCHDYCIALTLERKFNLCDHRRLCLKARHV